MPLQFRLKHFQLVFGVRTLKTIRGSSPRVRSWEGCEVLSARPRSTFLQPKMEGVVPYTQNPRHIEEMGRGFRSGHTYDTSPRQRHARRLNLECMTIRIHTLLCGVRRRPYPSGKRGECRSSVSRYPRTLKSVAFTISVLEANSNSVHQKSQRSFPNL